MKIMLPNTSRLKAKNTYGIFNIGFWHPEKYGHGVVNHSLSVIFFLS